MNMIEELERQRIKYEEVFIHRESSMNGIFTFQVLYLFPVDIEREKWILNATQFRYIKATGNFLQGESWTLKKHITYDAAKEYLTEYQTFATNQEWFKTIEFLLEEEDND